MTVRISRISLKHIGFTGFLIPVLVIDVVNVESKLYTLCYSLPQDTPERTERRISLLLRLIHKNLTNISPKTSQTNSAIMKRHETGIKEKTNCPNQSTASH